MNKFIINKITGQLDLTTETVVQSGPKGNSGVTGTTGADGSDGAVGATGEQGNIGITGTTGAQGLPGTTGATGTTGAQGTTGVEGAVGTTGTQGTTGADLTSIVVINAQSEQNYQLVINDVGKLITLNNSAPIAVTIPTNAVVEFLIGTRIDFLQKGEGKVTFSGSGVIINSKGNNKSIGAQNVAVSLIKEDTDTWYLIGDLIV
jgi:hypothetical protein